MSWTGNDGLGFVMIVAMCQRNICTIASDQTVKFAELLPTAPNYASTKLLTVDISRKYYMYID